MKFKTTWLVIAVFGALGAYLYFVDEPRERAAAEKKETEGVLLPHFDPARVTELVLEGTKGRIHLKRGAADRWSAVEPVADAADAGRVRTLLEDLKALRADRKVAEAGADLKAFGLDAPEVVVRTSGQAASVAVGAPNPTGEGRYARVDGGPVVLVKGYSLEGLLLAPGELRSRELLRGFPWDRLRSLTVKGAGSPDLKLVKADGRWRLEAPVSFEADPDAADALVEKLRWGKIASFPKGGDKTGPALAGGLSVAVVAEGQSEPAVLTLADVQGTVWARASGRDTAFTVDRGVLDAFRVKAADLRRLKPVLVKTWSAERLELSGGGRSARYEKSEGAWRRGGAAIRGAESEALQQLLQALEEQRAARVVDAPGADARYGLDAPRATVKLADSQGPEQLLQLGEKGQTVYARAGTSGPVYEMPQPDYLAKVLALLKLSASPVAGGSAAAAAR